MVYNCCIPVRKCANVFQPLHIVTSQPQLHCTAIVHYVTKLINWFYAKLIILRTYNVLPFGVIN